MENGKKGTVTPLASIFPVEDAQRAAKRVQDSIAERQKELDQVHHFIADNTNLINLVQKLPDELSHDIMVPFGKAAFFPGRLIHTNEFLVLLGEGYYVERSSKQTIEILQRRGNVLESQVDSLKAMMQDQKTEASFFDATAVEAAEGLVEIREEYVEENSRESMSSQLGLSKSDSLGSSKADNVKGADEDEEYAQMMSRLDELEKEELAAESVNEDVDEETDFGCSISQRSVDRYLRSSEEPQLRDSLQQSNDQKLFHMTAKNPLSRDHSEQEFANQSAFEDLKVLHAPKDKSNSVEKPLLLSDSKEKVHAVSSKSEGLKDAAISHSPKDLKEAIINHPPKVAEDNSTGCTSKTGVDSFKAFTGSIIEHTDGLQPNPVRQTAASSQSTVSQTSKPVSRFKMQKGSR